jgi:hypothetical protein
MNQLDAFVAMQHDVLLLIGKGTKSRKLLSQSQVEQRLSLQKLASLFGPVDGVTMLEPLESSERSDVSKSIGLAAIVSFSTADSARGHVARLSFKAFCDSQKLQDSSSLQRNAEASADAGDFFARGGWQAAWLGDGHDGTVLRRLGLRYADSARAAQDGGHADQLLCIVYYLSSVGVGGDDVVRAVALVPHAQAAVVKTLVLGDRVWVKCTTDDAAVHVADHIRQNYPSFPKGHLALSSTFPK